MQRMVSIYTRVARLKPRATAVGRPRATTRRASLQASHLMRREVHRWYSGRLGRELGVVVHGHWGPPMIMFPTSGGDEAEYERQSLIGAISEFIDAGKVKAFCVNMNHGDSFANRGAHPFHRSWMQRQYDEYIRHEVIPFARQHCQSPDAAVWTMGASLGAYHAANTLFKYPDIVKRCYALSGVYDMKGFMDGAYDDNFYFNNPVDYLANMSDQGVLRQL